MGGGGDGGGGGRGSADQDAIDFLQCITSLDVIQFELKRLGAITGWEAQINHLVHYNEFFFLLLFLLLSCSDSLKTPHISIPC